jgi:hypothetical protein
VAWRFAKYINIPQPALNGLSWMGEWLAKTVGIIPSRVSDQGAIDWFTDRYVNILKKFPKMDQGEEYFRGKDEIYNILWRYIEKAYYNQMSPRDSLNSAASEAEAVLRKYY